MFSTKNFFFVLITKAQKKFFKRMFKILFQNTYLQDGKTSCQFLTLKLSLSKVIQTLFLIFFRVSFYRENELSKVQILKNHKSLLCNGPSPTRKAQISKPKHILSFRKSAFKPVQTNLCSKDFFKSKSTVCG